MINKMSTFKYRQDLTLQLYNPTSVFSPLSWLWPQEVQELCAWNSITENMGRETVRRRSVLNTVRILPLDLAK